MKFKQVLEKILSKEQDNILDIFTVKNIDDLYKIFLQYNYEFSIEQFYEDFIDFFSFVLKNGIKELSDIESIKLSGGKKNINTRITASILSAIMTISGTNITQAKNIRNYRQKNKKENSTKSKAQKILDFTKFINREDLNWLLTIGLTLSVVSIINFIKNSNSPEGIISKFRAGIENTERGENYKNSIIELYVATHNRLLELSKIKNINKIQSSDISCDKTEEKLKQALKEKAQIFENQEYYQSLIEDITNIHMSNCSFSSDVSAKTDEGTPDLTEKEYAQQISAETCNNTNSPDNDYYTELFKKNNININIIELLQRMCFLQIDNYEKWTGFLEKLHFKDTRTRDRYITQEFFKLYIEVCTPNYSDRRRLANIYECYLSTDAPDEVRNDFLDKLKQVDTFFKESGLTENIDEFYIQALGPSVYTDEQKKRKMDIEQKRIIQNEDKVSVVSKTQITDVRQTLQVNPNYQYSQDFIDLYNSNLNQSKDLVLHPDLFKKRYYSDAYSKIDIKEVLTSLGLQNLPSSFDCDWYEQNMSQLRQAVRNLFEKWFLNATYGDPKKRVIGYAFDGASIWGSIFDQIIISGKVVSVFEDFIKFLYDFDQKATKLEFKNYSDIEQFSGDDLDKKQFKELWEELMLLWSSLTGGCYNQFISAINYVLTRYSNYLSVPPEDSESIFSSFSTELCKHLAETLMKEYVDKSTSQEDQNTWAAEVNRTYRTIMYNFLNIKTPLRVYNNRGFNDDSINMFNIVESLTKNLTVKSLYDFIKTQLRTGIFNFGYKKQIVQEFSNYTFDDGTDKDILKKLYGQDLFKDLKVLDCWMKKHNTANDERKGIDVFTCKMMSDVVGGFEKKNYETDYGYGFKDLPYFYEIKVPVGKLSAFYSAAVNYEETYIEDEEGNDTSTVIASKEHLDKFFSDLPYEDADNNEDMIDKKFPLAFIFKLKHEGFIDFYMSN